MKIVIFFIHIIFSKFVYLLTFYLDKNSKKLKIDGTINFPFKSLENLLKNTKSIDLTIYIISNTTNNNSYIISNNLQILNRKIELLTKENNKISFNFEKYGKITLEKSSLTIKNISISQNLNELFYSNELFYINSNSGSLFFEVNCYYEKKY